jgi:hypothetical protein
MMREGGSSQYGKSPSAKKAPTAVEHLLHVLDDEGGAHDIKLAPLPVSDRSPIVVAPPLNASGLPAMNSTLTLPIIAVSLIGVSARPNAGD